MRALNAKPRLPLILSEAWLARGLNLCWWTGVLLTIFTLAATALSYRYHIGLTFYWSNGRGFAYLREGYVNFASLSDWPVMDHRMHLLYQIVPLSAASGDIDMPRQISAIGVAIFYGPWKGWGGSFLRFISLPVYYPLALGASVLWLWRIKAKRHRPGGFRLRLAFTQRVLQCLGSIGAHGARAGLSLNFNTRPVGAPPRAAEPQPGE